MQFAHDAGPNQPGQLHRLIWAFVVHSSGPLFAYGIAPFFLTLHINYDTGPKFLASAYYCLFDVSTNY